MTNREFLNTVIETATSEEVKDHAKAMLTKMDERNEKRASTPSKTAIANEPIKANILAMLTTEPRTAANIAAALELTTQKVSSLLRQLAEAEQVVVTEVKVKGKGKVKGYAIPA